MQSRRLNLLSRHHTSTIVHAVEDLVQRSIARMWDTGHCGGRMTEARMIVRSIVATCLAVGAISCDRTTAPLLSVPGRPDVRGLVTADVFSSLDSDGHFIFSEVPGADGWRVASAGAASATVAAYAGLLRDQCTGAVTPSVIVGSILWMSSCAAVEQIHGTKINWDRVTVAPWPPYYSASPVVAVGDSIPASLRRAVGPRYHMFLAEGSALIADVAVSTDLSGVVLTHGVRPYFAALPSGVVRVEGLSKSIHGRVPLVPEVAVADVARRTGAKVAALPTLVEPWDHLGSVFARWLLQLDRDVVVIQDDTNARITTREVLIGLGPSEGGGFSLSWFVAVEAQPTTESWPFIWPESGQRDSLAFRFVPGVPIKVQRVHPEANARASK